MTPDDVDVGLQEPAVSVSASFTDVGSEDPHVGTID